ncbi:MAG TPA: permease [Polyangia bacterium]|nr:permease [Polyangia bacterium]
MIAGHFGLAAGVKARETAVPLWALMLATQWLDVVFVPLFLTHLERIDTIGGGPAGYGNGIIHADYTHSLVGAVVLSLVFALPAAWRWGRRAAVVLGAVVFSHWILDLIVHRHDMPLWPGAPADAPHVGFGLWRWPLATAAVELALVLWGGLAYLRAAVDAARARDPSRLRRARVAGAAVLISGLVTLGLSVAGL